MQLYLDVNCSSGEDDNTVAEVPMKCFWIIPLLVIVLLAGGCETVKGVGRDMQKAGDWVEESAK